MWSHVPKLEHGIKKQETRKPINVSSNKDLSNQKSYFRKSGRVMDEHHCQCMYVALMNESKWNRQPGRYLLSQEKSTSWGVSVRRNPAEWAAHVETPDPSTASNKQCYKNADGGVDVSIRQDTAYTERHGGSVTCDPFEKHRSNSSDTARTSVTFCSQKAARDQWEVK